MGRPEADGHRCLGMGILGEALRDSGRPEESLPVFKTYVAWRQRYWPSGKHDILISQNNLAICLSDLGRHDEVLVLKREIYAGFVAMCGESHHDTMGAGLNLAMSMNATGLNEEAKSFLHDRLLPMARRSVGADNQLTLMLGRILAVAHIDNPEGRGDLRLNQRSAASTRPVFIHGLSQATTCSKPRQSFRT